MKEKHRGFLMLLPNLLTLANALAGFTALLVFFTSVYQGRQAFGTVLAGWFILFAVLFDGLDGYAARKLDAASSTGLQLDSLADFLTFGAAPALILASTCIISGIPMLKILGSAAAGLYLSCAVWRLAVYNVMALEGTPATVFRGLPVPGAAAAVMSALVLAVKGGGSGLFLGLIALYYLLTAVLMVGKVSYVHMWKWITSERRGVRYLIIAVIFFILVFTLGPFPAITVFSVVYILSGPLGPVGSRILSARLSEKRGQTGAQGGGR